MPRERWTQAVAVVGTALVVAGVGSMLVRGRPMEVLYARWVLHNAPTAVIALWLGRMILAKEPRHRAGMILLWVGAWSCVHVAVIALADARLVAMGMIEADQTFVPADLPLDASVPLWLSSWLWLLAAVPVLTVLLLYFPDGHLPSRRWRWLVPTSMVGIGLMALAFAVEGWPLGTNELSTTGQISVNPLAVLLSGVGAGAIVVAAAASIASLVIRWRGAAGDQRRQIRLVAVTGVIAVVVLVGAWPWQWLWAPAGLLALWAFLAAYAFSVARYRLHDLDLVVSRAVVAAVLAAVVTAVYVTIAVGIGSLVGRGTERTVLPLLAAGVVAVLFEPTRRHVRRLVDRMLYGRDRDAYEVLTELAGRLREESSPGEVLDEVATLLVRGTGAERAEIVMPLREPSRVVAASGSADRPGPVLALPVVHSGEELGAVRLYARSATDLAPDASALVDGVAGTLGVVLRNAHLTAELQDQVVELRRSRERLVHAHAEARRSLERDIHDGAQSRLVALRIRLGMAADLAQREGSSGLRAAITPLGDEVDAAMRALRALAHGLCPPVLEGAGLAAALRAESRGLPLKVVVDDEGIGRYARAVESAVYFSCLEAIQNAVKHGRAQHLAIRLSNGASHLDFAVTDDGCGFDTREVPVGAGLTNVRDRLEALGGRLAVESTLGEGVTIAGRMPAQPLDSDK